MIGPIPVGGIVFACITLLTLVPIRRPRSLARLSWIASAGINEVPAVFMAIVIASTAPALVDGDVTWADDGVATVVAVFTVACLTAVAWRHRLAPRALRDALDDAIPEASADERRWSCTPSVTSALRGLLAPWPFRPRDVVRVADISYGDAGSQNMLDVYRHRTHPEHAPTLVYLHGGGFRRGRKNFEARPLVHHFARRGWTCISANYRLAPHPAAGFPDHLVDVKRVLAWARAHAAEHGIDPDTIVMCGSSAGAHLTMMVALTANESEFQPGFESADTTIAAGVGLYGYYGGLDGDAGAPSSPSAHVTPACPPLFVIHGDNDTYTPIGGARRFVAAVRSVSLGPVAYAELPGAQHSFDVFRSIRFDAVVLAIERFAEAVRRRS